MWLYSYASLYANDCNEFITVLTFNQSPFKGYIYRSNIFDSWTKTNCGNWISSKTRSFVQTCHLFESRGFHTNSIDISWRRKQINMRYFPKIKLCKHRVKSYVTSRVISLLRGKNHQTNMWILGEARSHIPKCDFVAQAATSSFNLFCDIIIKHIYQYRQILKDMFFLFLFLKDMLTT